MEDKFYLETQMRMAGASLVTVIPPEIIQYLDLKDGQKIRWTPDNSKWGKFVGVWNPKQQVKK